MKINSSGQAIVEASIGLSFFAILIISVFAYLFVSWTHFLVDSASETLTICTIEKRNAKTCIDDSKKWLQTAAPWLRIENIESHWATTLSGHLESESRIRTRFKLEGSWPATYLSRRRFCEKMKTASSFAARCS